MIRNAKKQDVVRRVLGVDGPEPANIIHVTPGQLEFLPPLQLQNTTGIKQLFTVNIMDDDDQYLPLEKELHWVHDEFELKEWIMRGHVKRPATFDSIHKYGVELQQGESVELLFKFLTVREVSFSEKV